MISKVILTIAVPVFNTAPYLEETFFCIENQTFGMDNMEVILINDGSLDTSGIICQEFQKKYAKNVQYIALSENHGVSYARNMALDMAHGTYITFWDSDDLWSLNAMERAVSFLDDHKTEIDMVSSNIEYFDSQTNHHVLNQSIKEDAIINIQREYYKIRTGGPVCVIRTSAAKKFRFDESQTRWEDAKYINQLLLQKKKYGMLKDVLYYYRRRRSNDSATQSHYEDKRYYLHDLGTFFEGIYEESLRQCGEFIPMMQYLMAYALGYYFSEDAEILSEEEHHQYDGLRNKILSYIDDRYVKEIPNVDFWVKVRILSFKHGLKIDDEINGRIGQWRQKEQQVQWNSTRMSRTMTNYNVLKRWFTLKQQEKSLLMYFEKNGYFQIAVYGMSDLGIYLLEELEASRVQIVYGIDRQAEKAAEKIATGRLVGIPVYKPEDELPEADVIIVTAVYFFTEIDEMLRQKVTCPVISLEDVLYTIE